MTVSPKSLPGKNVGSYQVLELLQDQGGYSYVFRGRSSKTGQEVAIKVMREGVSSEYQFLEEAQKCLRLRHPNIVELLDYFPSPYGPCLVYEMLEGANLHRLIQIGEPFPRPQMIGVFEEILKAVEFVHHHGYVHRDIKPSNIFITDNGHVKLMDFGITKPLPKKTVTLAVLLTGTPGYIAPELYEGRASTTASDVYSLGVVLRNLLTWSVDTGRVTFKELLQVDPLWYVVWRATLKDRARRVQDIAGLRRLLVTQEQVPLLAKPIIPVVAALVLLMALVPLIFRALPGRPAEKAAVQVMVNPRQEVEVVTPSGEIYKWDMTFSPKTYDFETAAGQTYTIRVNGTTMDGERTSWTIKKKAEPGLNTVEIPEELPPKDGEETDQ